MTGSSRVGLDGRRRAPARAPRGGGVVASAGAPDGGSAASPRDVVGPGVAPVAPARSGGGAADAGRVGPAARAAPAAAVVGSWVGSGELRGGAVSEVRSRVVDGPGGGDAAGGGDPAAGAGRHPPRPAWRLGPRHPGPARRRRPGRAPGRTHGGSARPRRPWAPRARSAAVVDIDVVRSRSSGVEADSGATGAEPARRRGATRRCERQARRRSASAACGARRIDSGRKSTAAVPTSGALRRVTSTPMRCASRATTMRPSDRDEREAGQRRLRERVVAARRGAAPRSRCPRRRS